VLAVVPRLIGEALRHRHLRGAAAALVAAIDQRDPAALLRARRRMKRQGYRLPQP
jgi:hypothetical protein